MPLLPYFWVLNRVISHDILLAVKQDKRRETLSRMRKEKEGAQKGVSVETIGKRG